ncbi:sugar ABC transporter permease [Paenibacillus sp. MWE-103]|uniref:Sugar ABC transporter permease n=1 Tax=Paenibacillus artemisiicola TaxID=1172618 RepID=A0ABS3WEK2_9BACL|nr:MULTISPECIES: sugar ABC transporter permease [Paenibacillus]MBO7746729.1 sugar ABC transporter permease [Paenibacillus artemisiicola]SFJ75963.1 raffinose/stachyose/melibiose transport system permease protein [Paenibacillus sp. UNC496MF]
MYRALIKRPWMSLLAFAAPALVFYAIFLLVPTIGGIYYSFTDWNGLYRHYNFVGFANYIESFTDDSRFIYSLFYTLKYVLAIVILQNVIGLSLALLVESRMRTKSLFRTLFFLPNMFSVYISTLMWTFIFSTVFPQLAEKTVLHILDQPWLGSSSMAFVSILLVSVWQGAGYLMVIYIAALQGVPRDLQEAATIDGATTFRKFLHITLPMIMPAITICVFLTLNGSFKIFEVVYALTGGGPGYSTEVIAFNIYQEGFARDLRYGYATAKAMILFLIILVITVTQVSVLKKREVEA